MTSKPLDVCLDIFGQHPRHNQIFTPVCLAFPCDEHVSEESILAYFQDGLKLLAHNFPWIAGQVIRDDDNIFRIRPCREAPLITVKDLRRDFPSMIAECLKSGSGGVPASLLDETTLAPCGTFRHSAGPAVPVFLLQANLVPGGLLLVLNGLHSCMDMAGQAQMIRLLAKACRGEPFSDEELSTGNLSRRDILLPLLHLSDEDLLWRPKTTTVAVRSENPTADLTENKDSHKNTSSTATAPDRQEEHRRPPQAALRWSTFVFSGPALQDLKAAATATMPSAEEKDEERIPFISTDDALSALLWQSITRSRLPRLPSHSEPPTTLTRTVDARSYVTGLPRNYPGDAAFKVSRTFYVASLLSKPLGAVAAGLRARLRPDEVRDSIRAHVTKFARSESSDGDNNGGGGGGGLDPSTGVNLSSWAKESCYDFDFGSGGGRLGLVGLGRPTVVQRPVFIDDAWESVVYLMPKRPDGQIAVLICLREEDMKGLQEDSGMARYGQYVG